MSTRVAGTRTRVQTGVDFRDPRGATRTGLQHVGIGRAQRPTWDAANAIKHGYQASWLVNRAVNILADRISSLPFRAGADPEDPEDYNLDAPLAKLLGPPPGNPNPNLSARALWKHAIKNYLITGRFAWEIDTEAPTDTRVELWPLIMGGFSPLLANGGRQYFTGFEYLVNGSTPIPYKRDEIVYAWNASAGNPMEAESPLQALALNVSIVAEVDSYSYAFLKNDAKPSAVVVHGPFADAASKQAFMEQFMSSHRGPLNANKTAFMEVDPDDDGEVGGMADIKVIGATNRDSQLVDIYEQQLRAVSGGLGVPMSLLDASGRTFDNAGQESTNFYELTVMPLCADLQDHVNRDLAPRLGNDVGWFDFGNVEALKPKLTKGVSFSDVRDDLLRNERRSFAGLGAVDEKALLEEKEANIALAKQTATPVGERPDPEKEAVSKPDPEPTENDEDDEKIPVPRSRGEEMSDAIRTSREVAIARIADTFGRQIAHLDERSLRGTLTRAEGKRGRQMLDKSEGVDAIYDRQFWAAEARASLAPIYEVAAGAASVALAGFVEDVDMGQWVDSRAAALADLIVDRRMNSLADGLRADMSQDELVELTRAAHDGDLGSMTDLAAFAFDDAVRHLRGVSVDTVRALLTRVVVQDLDFNDAMKELSR